MQQTNCCPSCLVSGRRLRAISGSKSVYFVSILSEIEDTNHCECRLVCWECEARISSALKFRSRVQDCHKALRNIGCNGLIQPRISDLNITMVHKATYLPLSGHFDSVKTEEAWLPEQKVSKENEKLDIVKNENAIDTIPDDDYHSLDNFDCKAEDENNIAIKDKLDKENTDKPSKKKKKHKNLFKMVEITEIENENDRREIRNNESFQTSMYKCDTCVVVFSDEKRFEAHMKTKHDKINGSYECAICKTILSTENDLVSHFQKHVRRYECLICGVRSPTKRTAHNHHKTSHVKRLSTQMTSGHHACTSCSKVFRWKASLRKHLESHRILSGESETPRCDVCKLSFKSIDCLQKHVSTSIKHQIQLKLQGATGTSREQVAQVTRAAREASAQFVCPHCDARFLYKGNLSRHIDSHKARASGKLYCKECDRKFSSLATYQNHMNLSKRHAPSVESWRHECADCGKRFMDKRKLKDHVDYEHLKNFTYTCQPCDKVFKSSTSLYLHKQAVHSDSADEHLCHHCARPYKSAQKLRAHLLAQHSSEHPYKCKFCTASFAWQSCVSRHVKVVHEKIKCKTTKKKEESNTRL